MSVTAISMATSVLLAAALCLAILQQPAGDAPALLVIAVGATAYAVAAFTRSLWRDRQPSLAMVRAALA